MNDTPVRIHTRHMWLVVLGVALVAGCVLGLLLPLHHRYEIGGASSSGAERGTQSITFGCGSVVSPRHFTGTDFEGMHVAGSGAFMTAGDLLGDGCARSRMTRSIRVAPLLLAGVLCILLGWRWPRRRSIRWAGVASASILAALAVLVPINGTLGW